MKNFNENDFNAWIQDTQNYSTVNTAEEYLARKMNDLTVYCIKVIGMVPNKALIVADSVYNSESKRLGL